MEKKLETKIREEHTKGNFRCPPLFMRELETEESHKAFMEFMQGMIHKYPGAIAIYLRDKDSKY